ncbi:MAG TPA: hypothetical protein VN624_17670, partial [Rhodanobacter sp.]|nr:hypothetical protein [Rhodanobacter sp.]
QVVTHSTQDVHTIHLRTLSKIVRPTIRSMVAPEPFVPGEPPILHRFLLPSTPSMKLRGVSIMPPCVAEASMGRA